MKTWKLAMIAVAALAVAHLLLSVLSQLLARPDRGGRREKGIVIFVESIRWMGVRWGLRGAAAGLRQAGFEGEITYWRWHASWRGWLVLPAIMDQAMLEREAKRLADFLAGCAGGGPVYLMGYSCGGYVATRALEVLSPDVRIDGVALLAPAVDPRRDLAPAASRVRGRFVVSRSLGDWFIVGLGTLLFGTGDRRHAPSLGMVGPRRPVPPNVVDLPWRLGMVPLGNLGGHFSAAAPAYIARRVAPAMGVGLP